MRVYTGSRDGVIGRVERDHEKYAQRRQANTEVRRDFGHPGEVISQVVNAQRRDQWRRFGGTLKRFTDE